MGEHRNTMAFQDYSRDDTSICAGLFVHVHRDKSLSQTANYLQTCDNPSMLYTTVYIIETNEN